MVRLIFINGMPGSGKTKFGKKLANAIEWNFIDLDNFITQESGLSPAQWISNHGEPRFREIEKEHLIKLVNLEKHVVSCGGGTPCFFNNLELMQENGLTIYLEMNPKALLSRINQGDGLSKRPLLNNSKLSLLDELQKTLSKREDFYNQMKITLDGLNPDIESVKLNF